MRPAFRSPMMFTTALVVSITINAKLELVFFVAATVFVPLLFLMVRRVRPLYMRM